MAKGMAPANKAPATTALEQSDWLPELEQWLAAGRSYTTFAEAKNVTVYALYALIEKTSQARARAEKAREQGAHAIVDEAERVLREAPRDPSEISRAAHLSKLLQWKASKFSKAYADKQEVNVTGAISLASMIKELDTPSDDTLTIEGEYTSLPVDK